MSDRDRLRLRGGRKQGPGRPQRPRRVASSQVKQNLAVLGRQNFSILKRGNRYTLRAKDITKGVLAQIKSFLKNKKGQAYVDGEKMSRDAAFRYIVAQLRNRAVEVAFRRK